MLAKQLVTLIPISNKAKNRVGQYGNQFMIKLAVQDKIFIENEDRSYCRWVSLVNDEHFLIRQEEK